MKTKALLLVLCAVLLVVSTVFATMAFLTSETDVIENTFTVGNVKITMDEVKVDLYGEVLDNEPRDVKNDYRLIPGHEYTKDPIIHVEKGSEKCYLFVEVVNPLESVIDGTSIEEQMNANGWIRLEDNVWYNVDDVDASAAEDDVDVPVFESFKISGDAEHDDLKDLEGALITVTAYAVQADGFDSAADAWDATFGASVNP